MVLLYPDAVQAESMVNTDGMETIETHVEEYSPDKSLKLTPKKRSESMQ